jgi:ubiquinone/menaquinone biosynthesis C-methylase UbiE
MDRIRFYESLVKKKIKNKNAKIIVFGAGENDLNIFKKLNYKNVTFSNLNIDNHKTIKINIHQNNLDDEEYDYSITNASIHHSSKPHMAILEMYRVSREGVLIIEANDSLLVRAAVKLCFAEEFEISAIKNGSTGVDNTNIPNFIFRWNEREIYKLLNSYKPDIIHDVNFEYENDIRLSKIMFLSLKIILSLFFLFFKKQQNLMGIFINKENQKKRF